MNVRMCMFVCIYNLYMYMYAFLKAQGTSYTWKSHNKFNPCL